MNSNELKAEIERREAQLKPALQEIEALKSQYGRARSMEWIAANRVHRSDIEHSKDGGKPHFGHLGSYSTWLSRHSTKRWAEWNGLVYERTSLIRGYFDPQNTAYFDDVPE